MVVVIRLSISPPHALGRDEGAETRVLRPTKPFEPRSAKV
jgi:hypothetical protein